MGLSSDPWHVKQSKNPIVTFVHPQTIPSRTRQHAPRLLYAPNPCARMLMLTLGTLKPYSVQPTLRDCPFSPLLDVLESFMGQISRGCDLGGGSC